MSRETEYCNRRDNMQTADEIMRAMRLTAAELTGLEKFYRGARGRWEDIEFVTWGEAAPL